MASFLTLEKGQCNVLAMCTVDEFYVVETPALIFLHGHSKAGAYTGSAKGFKKLFQRYADGGRNKLTAELFHEVDKPEGIWQFIKGDLRVFCFFDGKNVVLSHGAIKESQRVDPAEVTRAVGMKTKYFQK